MIFNEDFHYFFCVLFSTNPIIKYLSRNLVEIGEKVDSADFTHKNV